MTHSYPRWTTSLHRLEFCHLKEPFFFLKRVFLESMSIPWWQAFLSSLIHVNFVNVNNSKFLKIKFPTCRLVLKSPVILARYEKRLWNSPYWPTAAKSAYRAHIHIYIRHGHFCSFLNGASGYIRITIAQINYP